MYKRLHNLKKGNKYKFISMVIFFTFSLLILSYAYSFSNSKLEVNNISKIGYSNLSSEQYNATLVSKWQSDNLYYYHYNIDINYTESIPAIGWTAYIRVPMDAGSLSCFGTSTCDITGTLLRLEHPTWQNVINNGDKISIGFQISTTDANYTLSLVSVFYDKQTDTYEDLYNVPYKENIPGEIDEETTDQQNAYNFNDNDDSGWYLESTIRKGLLLDFNGGKALGIYLDNSEIFNLKNDTLISSKYNLVNYKIYIPKVSNIEGITINNQNINSYKVTEDNRYNVFYYTNNFNSSYVDSIKINSAYKGYIIIDSIYLNSNNTTTPDDNFIEFNFKPTSGWSNITQYDITLTNKSNSNINIIDWKILIYIPSNCSLVTSWVGNTVVTDEYISITPNSWQTELPPGGQVSGGLQLDNPTCPATCSTKYKTKILVTTKELEEIEFNYE